MTVNVKKSWLMTALFGLLIAVLGILMIAYSSSAWKILIVLVGLGFVINAFFDISTIKLSPIVFKKWAISNMVLDLLLGVLFVSTIISWVIGTLLIIYGIGMISEVCVFRPQYLLTRMIIVSLLSIAFGVLFIFDPSSFSTTVMLVIGIPCIVVGVMLLVGSIIYRVKKGKVQDAHIFSDDAPTYEQTATVISEEENSTESPSSDNS